MQVGWLLSKTLSGLKWNRVRFLNQIVTHRERWRYFDDLGGCVLPS